MRKKVKQEIQNDVRAGQGAMTSREAGAMRGLRIHSLLVFLVCLFLKHLPVMSVYYKNHCP